MAETKNLIEDLSAARLSEQLDTTLKYHLNARNSKESKEGIAAFMEKREPSWLS